MIRIETVVKNFLKLSVLNTIVAIIFLFPILIPQLAFPILITERPGIYMVLAYFIFLIAAVIGFIAWTFVYYLLWKLYEIKFVKRNLVYAQIILLEIGSLLASIFMYWGGYVGSSSAYSGMSEFVVGIMMEFATIPSGLGIGLILFGNLFGILNLILAWKE